MARILAVDDERAILDALARVLGRDGHEVVKAADPTAVPGTDLSRFDLVLTLAAAAILLAWFCRFEDGRVDA